MAKFLIGLAVVVVVVIVLAASQASRRPSEAELKDVVREIYEKCEQRVYGRKRFEGERSSPGQSEQMVSCVDVLGAAYIRSVRGY